MFQICPVPDSIGYAIGNCCEQRVAYIANPVFFGGQHGVLVVTAEFLLKGPLATYSVVYLNAHNIKSDGV